MLSSNQGLYDLSRRRNDLFYAEGVREKPFDTIVCSKTEVSGVSCLKDRAEVALYADASLFAFMHVPGMQGSFNILMSLTIHTSFGFLMQKSSLPDFLQPF